ncbi:hypothetical protein BESB_023620 [Besnoitia besnoiti]|uniref:Uncharacterized protein n=1 Tax=Besnoitia besnoiti TaxID=94643 RepID=A0A2A9M906_BESBE|nr:hypothetical protein BESB_023620 [Besnoitia besnoiti]PFH31870.1 hypothetical protein BESB_023620 [Besnoitia besnoiti]
MRVCSIASVDDRAMSGQIHCSVKETRARRVPCRPGRGAARKIESVALLLIISIPWSRRYFCEDIRLADVWSFTATTENATSPGGNLVNASAEYSSTVQKAVNVRDSHPVLLAENTAHNTFPDKSLEVSEGVREPRWRRARKNVRLVDTLLAIEWHTSGGNAKSPSDALERETQSLLSPLLPYATHVKNDQGGVEHHRHAPKGNVSGTRPGGKERRVKAEPEGDILRTRRQQRNEVALEKTADVSQRCASGSHQDGADRCGATSELPHHNSGNTNPPFRRLAIHEIVVTSLRDFFLPTATAESRELSNAATEVSRIARMHNQDATHNKPGSTYLLAPLPSRFISTVTGTRGLLSGHFTPTTLREVIRTEPEGGVARYYSPEPQERSPTWNAFLLDQLERRFDQLTDKEKYDLVNHVSLRAFSHLEWLYEWQKTYAPTLLLVQQERDEANSSSPATNSLSSRVSEPSAHPDSPAFNRGTRKTVLRSDAQDDEEEFGYDIAWKLFTTTGHLAVAPEAEEGVEQREVHTDAYKRNPYRRNGGAGNRARADALVQGGVEGIAEGQALWDETLIALKRKNIPNITYTVDQINEDVGVFLERYRDAVWSLPLQHIVNATLNGGIFPDLVERQSASYPDFKRNVRCNPEPQSGVGEALVCQNLGNFLREFGTNLRRVYGDSYLYGIHKRAEDLAGFLHYTIVSTTVTEALFEFVEQHVTVAALEAVLNATSSLIEIPVESQVFQLMNALLSLGGDFYSLADMPAVEFENKNLVRSKVRNAFYCRLFNGRLHFCRPSGIPPTISINIPRETVFDPATGFIKFLYLIGFQFSCEQQGGCFADILIEGDNFDGFYVLAAVGTTGFPVYVAYREFANFPELTQLYLWQGLRPSVVDATQASWAAITPFFPESYYAATRGQLFPFASLASLTPPNNCSDVPPTPFGDTNTNFPACMNITRQWVIGRVSAFGNCNGFLYSHVCVFPAIVETFPTSNPETWTAETSTTTPPASTTPSPTPGQPGPSPPGGGVSPQGVGFVPEGQRSAEKKRLPRTDKEGRRRMSTTARQLSGGGSGGGETDAHTLPLWAARSADSRVHNDNTPVFLGGEELKLYADRLRSLTGTNGRQFQSAIPVHRSQFVDGFSGKLDIYIPPFLHIPPDIW